MDKNLCVITEQGDLGLGINPVSEEDKDKLTKKKDEDKSSND